MRVKQKGTRGKNRNKSKLVGAYTSAGTERRSVREAEGTVEDRGQEDKEEGRIRCDGGRRRKHK